ncbi:4'-phosphopantetheinyl transferase family protein [Amaricoccus solimangrovi]|uniref:Enterobactin synthase component D n=1 Tax=Amaricoccus solimangrovi TaxID=2589815 RepID=A0A501WMK2_9RHOB|nr:4'-phosphopantetheinyl transferase superfamily protein [Amaricoccus solimangrovi]TPE49570.1 4'-phosphopantetheinyl transferase superfamily protein [Amaricoccus solimangrovi]
MTAATPRDPRAGLAFTIEIGASAGVIVAASERRAAIAAARRRLGLPEGPVGREARGAPVWPAGQRGSLSHWAGISVCLLTRGESVDPGVDLEGFADAPTRGAIRQEALSPTEAGRLDAARLPEGAGEALVFSAKESFFKAVYPRIGRRIGFDAAELHETPGEGRLALRVTRRLAAHLPAGRVLRLEFRILDGAVLTWLTLRR